MKKLWGGRFSKKLDPLAEEFSQSVHYDYKLAQSDVFGSIIHVKILENSGILTSEEAAKLLKGLDSIFKKVESPDFRPPKKEEDIHSYIQNELQKEAGEAALKLHTARSRNEQVVFATKVYSKLEIDDLKDKIKALGVIMIDLALQNKEIIIPGFTHMQHAQPVYLADYLTAYVEMLERDRNRLGYISKNIKVTLGAGALAGTPINSASYAESAKELLKEEIWKKIADIFILEPTTNSLDAVSDRDFIIEIISALSIAAMHLSRLAEDLIIWATKEFDFVEIDEAFCTGSSLMPQKKNADILELIRGNTGRIYGNLVSVLTMMKGLPLTYNRDMQLDKEPLFNSFEIISRELVLMRGIMKTLKFNKKKISEHLKDESLYATDLVYYLVDKGVAFKTAHTIIGELVKYSLANDIEIKKIPADKLKSFSPELIREEIVKLFDPRVSVESKKSIKRA